MDKLLLTVFNMSITSSYVILAVFFIRFLIKRYPKFLSYSLWAVVLLRLIVPFSFSSSVSFLNLVNPKEVPLIYEKTLEENTIKNLATNYVNTTSKEVLSIPISNHFPSVINVLSIIWILVITILIVYTIIQYIKFKHKIINSKHIEKNIYECENINSPFTFGFVKPKIFLPINLSENEKPFIIKHEQIHIKRFDHIIKPIFYLCLCIHWFNPLVWLSFIYMCKDMEMSCDEAVLKSFGNSIKKDYSSSLLALATKGSMVNPLAFGENTKDRIKNVLSYKKPAFLISMIMVIIIGIVSFSLISNPKTDTNDSFLSEVIDMASKQERVFLRQKSSTNFVGGKWFGNTLKRFKNTLKQKNPSTSIFNDPELVVYLKLDPNYRISFYDSESTIEMNLNGKHKYYEYSKDMLNEINTYSIAISGNKDPDEIIAPLFDGKRTRLQSVNDVPNSENVRKVISISDYYIYKKLDKYYAEVPYMFINEITKEMYDDALMFSYNLSGDTSSMVEDNINMILNGSDDDRKNYTNTQSYQNIWKMGDEALNYMITQFQNKNTKDLRGEIMMSLCKDILGTRNNVADENLTPDEWFSKLKIRNPIPLSDFSYDGNDATQKLVYEAVNEHEKDLKKMLEDKGAPSNVIPTFMVAAPHIFGSYEEGNKIAIFATIIINHYILYDDNILASSSASSIPVAIIYNKNSDGSYTMESYTESSDGERFAPSIKEFCKMPVSGKEIKGLSDKMLNHYGSYEDIIKLERENLIKHLKKNGLNGVFLDEPWNKPNNLTPLT